MALMARSAVLAALATTALAASSEDWRSRSIYQVLTDRFAREDGSTTAECDAGQGRYCGGTFNGLANKLDYIQGAGFDAVWISPITAQIDSVTEYGDPYHGYWQQDIFQVNSNFGTADDLKALAGALHDRGMYLMVDIVVNHFGWNGPPEDVDYSKFNPFNSQKYFHDYCEIDYVDVGDNNQLETCWMGDTKVSLPDVKTEDTAGIDGAEPVAQQWYAWIGNLTSFYGIDGYRLDSAIEVNREFWPGFGEAANAYFVGETFNPGPEYVCEWQDHMPGIMDYPTYEKVKAAFRSTPNGGDTSLMTSLADTIDAVKGSCKDTSLKGTFTENHDNDRFAQINGDMSAAKNMLAYTLLTDGIPIVYQGQEQHYNSQGGQGDPYNREALWLSGYNTDAELYQFVKTLNAARKAAIADDGGFLTYQYYAIYTDTSTIALKKGSLITVLSNNGDDGASYSQVIPAKLEAGTEVTEVLSCETVTVGPEGGIEVPMQGGLPRVYYPSSAVGGLCGGGGGSEKRGEHLKRHVEGMWQA